MQMTSKPKSLNNYPDTSKYKNIFFGGGTYGLRLKYNERKETLPTLSTYNGTMQANINRSIPVDSLEKLLRKHKNVGGGRIMMVSEDETKEQLLILSATGETMGQTYHGAMSSREVIDTVRIYNDTGTIKLNQFAKKGRKVTVPSKADRLKVVVTARDALNYKLSWGWDYIDFKDNAEIRIRNNGDSSFTGLVDVQIKVR